MRITIGAGANASEVAERIRKQEFPGCNAQRVKDSFIFDRYCIKAFDQPAEILLPYIEDDTSVKVQRNLSLTSQSYEKLLNLARQIGRPVAATFRGLVSYADQHYKKKASEASSLEEKLALLQSQLDAARACLEEIRIMMNSTQGGEKECP